MTRGLTRVCDPLARPRCQNQTYWLTASHEEHPNGPKTELRYLVQTRSSFIAGGREIPLRLSSLFLSRPLSCVENVRTRSFNLTGNSAQFYSV